MANAANGWTSQSKWRLSVGTTNCTNLQECYPGIDTTNIPKMDYFDIREFKFLKLFLNHAWPMLFPISLANLESHFLIVHKPASFFQIFESSAIEKKSSTNLSKFNSLISQFNNFNIFVWLTLLATHDIGGIILFSRYMNDYSLQGFSTG